MPFLDLMSSKAFTPGNLLDGPTLENLKDYVGLNLLHLSGLQVKSDAEAELERLKKEGVRSGNGGI